MARVDAADGRHRYRSSSCDFRQPSQGIVEQRARLGGRSSGASRNRSVNVTTELADVPPFNPDLDTDTAPAGVARFRAALEACDALLICSPEYAHGVSGVLKNALDWVVGSGELMDKPIALINASTRATHAHASLQETLTTMSGRVIEEASVTIPLEGAKWRCHEHCRGCSVVGITERHRSPRWLERHGLVRRDSHSCTRRAGIFLLRAGYF